MYKIKQKHRDFYVEEIPNYHLAPGPYAYFWLEKKGLNTLEAVKLIARQLGISHKKIGYAGNKDKKAVTKQVCSAYSIKKEQLDKIKPNKIKIKYIGQNSKPVSLGDLKGNLFKITVRNLTEKQIKKIKPIQKIINFFDEQRFSTDNIEIGQSMVKGNFQKTTELLLKNNLVKNKIKNHLEKNPCDFVGAVKKVDKKLLMLFIHAYQAKLWNETVQKILQAKPLPKVKSVPIIGFGFEIKNPQIKKITASILKKEKLSPRDFIIRQIPDLSAEGTERDIFAKIKDFKILEKAPDELNKNRKKIKISFSLPKGSYGTMVVKTLLAS